MNPGAVIDDFTDPRLDGYRDLHNMKDRRFDAGTGRFIAESELVVRKLLTSGLAVESILATETRWRSLAATTGAEAVRPDIPVYRVSQSVMDQVTGFHFHRGCLAIGHRPATTAIPDGARLIVALENLVDVDNVGAVVRNACAFGVDALILSPQSADPYYRKAIRVAMGNTFFLPVWRADRWPDDLLKLKQSGFTLVGTTLSPTAQRLPDWRPTTNTVLIFGSEGPGLAPATLQMCDHLVTIPMVNADSLNVGTACAIFLYHAVYHTD